VGAKPIGVRISVASLREKIANVLSSGRPAGSICRLVAYRNLPSGVRSNSAALKVFGSAPFGRVVMVWMREAALALASGNSIKASSLESSQIR
jgi:hypothetical protein